MIKVILRFVLGERVDISGDMVTVALEAFDKHSQVSDEPSRTPVVFFRSVLLYLVVCQPL